MSKRAGDPGYAPGWCIHYRGITGQKGERVTSCEAGVEYETFRGHRMSGQPCFLDDKGESKPGALSCEHLRRPTPDEISAHEKWAEERLNRTLKTIKAIEPWREKHKGQSAQDVIECPICTGKLKLSIAAYNGHVHAACETPGCVQWME